MFNGRPFCSRSKDENGNCDFGIEYGPYLSGLRFSKLADIHWKSKAPYLMEPHRPSFKYELAFRVLFTLMNNLFSCLNVYILTSKGSMLLYNSSSPTPEADARHF